MIYNKTKSPFGPGYICLNILLIFYRYTENDNTFFNLLERGGWRHPIQQVCLNFTTFFNEMNLEMNLKNTDMIERERERVWSSTYHGSCRLVCSDQFG